MKTAKGKFVCGTCEHDVGDVETKMYLDREKVTPETTRDAVPMVHELRVTCEKCKSLMRFIPGVTVNITIAP